MKNTKVKTPNKMFHKFFRQKGGKTRYVKVKKKEKKRRDVRAADQGKKLAWKRTKRGVIQVCFHELLRKQRRESVLGDLHRECESNRWWFNQDVH